MRDADGAIWPSPTAARPGREKKPSVISADVPSSISSVVTPAQVTVSGASAAAPGTSKCRVYFRRSGRPGLSRIR